MPFKFRRASVRHIINSAPTMLIVFLNNKLMSADTIAPLLFEFSLRHPAEKIEVVCFGHQTLDVVKANMVVYDALTRSGRLYAFGGESSSRWARVATATFRFLRLAGLALMKKATFLHFKALNRFPLRILYHLNPERTFFCQASNAYASEAHVAALKVLEPRSFATLIPAARHLVGFDERWWAFQDVSAQGYIRTLVSPPYRRAVWLDHLKNTGDALLRNLGLGPSERCFVFVLSTMDRQELLANPDGYPDLFAATLAALVAEAPDIPVLIKRHPATLQREMAIQERLVKESGHRRVHFVDIHPLVMSSRSLAFIANSYSSTLDFGHYMGVPTIEFTQYSAKALAATKGGSICPRSVDFFTQDVEQFRAIITQVLNHSPQERRPIADRSKSYEELLDLLATAPSVPAIETLDSV